jgi:hypothetical protein
MQRLNTAAKEGKWRQPARPKFIEVACAYRHSFEKAIQINLQKIRDKNKTVCFVTTLRIKAKN